MKSVEESMRELMAFCEQQQKQVKVETAVLPEGWRRSLQRAISVAYMNVYSVLGSMTDKQSAADSSSQTNQNEA